MKPKNKKISLQRQIGVLQADSVVAHDFSRWGNSF
jgi:hypothetical protein